MDHGFSVIMNIFGLTVEEIKNLAMNQYTKYVHHAVNLMAGYRQGEMEFAYTDTKENKLRNRLQQLKAEAEARKNDG